MSASATVDNDVDWAEVSRFVLAHRQTVALYVADLNDLRRDQDRLPWRGAKWYRIQWTIDRLIRALYEVDRPASREQRGIEYLRA